MLLLIVILGLSVASSAASCESLLDNSSFLIEAGFSEASGRRFGDFGSFDDCSLVADSRYVRFDAAASARNWVPNFPCFHETRWCDVKKAGFLATQGVGLCVPSVCNNVSLLAEFAEKMLNGEPVNKSTARFPKFSNDMSALGIVWLTCFAMLFVTCVACTIIEVFMERRSATEIDESEPLLAAKEQKKDDPLLLRLAKCFSFKRNVKSLLATGLGAGGEESFAFLNGLRFISRIFVTIINLALIVQSTYALMNNMPFFLVDVMPSFAYQATHFVTYGTDSFFVFSGCLVTLSLFKGFDQKSFRLWHYLLHRFLRLFPLMLASVTFAAFVLPSLSAGPNWKDYDMTIKTNCKHFWVELLFLNDIWLAAGFRADCNPPDWYLATEIHLYWFAPLFVYLFTRRSIWGWVVIGFFTIFSVVWSCVSVYIPFFFETFSRMNAFFVGIGLGVVLFGYDGKLKKKEIGPKLAFVLYAAVLATWCILYCVPLAGLQPDRGFGVFFYGVDRFVGSISIAVLVFLLFNDCGKTLIGWLSSPLWTPIARLSFAMYLVHWPVMVYLVFSQQSSFWWSWINYLGLLLSVLFLSFLFAIALYFVVERPCINLERMFLK